MDYVFGKVKRKGAYVENLKTIGAQHSQLSGVIEVVREYPDNIITDAFRIVEHYKTAVDEEGRCYDWYIIADHSRTMDNLSPVMKCTYEEAKEARLIVEGYAASLDDAAASVTPHFTREMAYDGKLIAAGTRIQWEGGLKRAAVDLWDTEANNPANAPNLWEDVAYYKGYRIIPDVFTSTTAFGLGEVGYFKEDGCFYESLMAGNTYQPVIAPDVWKKREDIN